MMSPKDILAFLRQNNATVSCTDGELRVRAPQGIVNAHVLQLLKQHKADILAALQPTAADTPAHATYPEQACAVITPDMLPLLDLPQAAIEQLVASLPRGAANIQDIYPLSPMQEGVLFHHLLDSDGEGDTYLLRKLLAFDDRPRLDAFLKALQIVIDRHDILRTSIHWQDLSRAVQVVHRSAQLPVTDLSEPMGDSWNALTEHTNPRRMRMDLHAAPLLHAYIAAKAGSAEWLLALVGHHIVIDHVTLELVLQEISLLLQDQPERLPQPVPYRNFIAQLQAAPVARHDDYFTRQLADVEHPTAAFGVFNVRGCARLIHERELRLDDLLAQQIRNSARQHGVSPAVLFHVAFAQVLAHCSQCDDVVFGTVLSGRLQASGVERALGLFINTLPIRIPLRDANALSVVRDAQLRLLELLQHEQAPLALAQRCSGVQPPLPLFTAVLNYRHSGEAYVAEHSWPGVRLLADEERTNYPLVLSINDFGGAFSFSAQCIQGIDAQQVNEHLAAAIAVLLECLERSSSQPLLSMPVVSAAQRQQLLAANGVQRHYSDAQTIHGLFEAQAQRRPDAVALILDTTELSYAELNARANQLARHLIHAGLRREEIVAVCLDRSVELIVSLLAVMKAGAAYVVLDPNFPAERLGFTLQQTAASILLSQQRYLSKVPCGNSTAQLVLLDLHADHIAAQPQSNLGLHVSRNDLAYCIYTSGSTGRPKGVALTHVTLLGMILDIDYARFDEQCVILQHSAISWDALTLELWPVLLHGGRCVLYAGSKLAPAELAQYIQRFGINLLWLTASFFNVLVDEDTRYVRGIKQLLTGSEQVSRHHIRKLLREQPGIHLVNCYGPSECNVFSTCYVVPADLGEGGISISIGKPVGDRRVYILDARGNLVPPGVCGELYVAGDAVARGYVNRPDLTAERFLRDPFVADPTARMYKTGDLGRWLPGGTIEYLGRNDFQVKIRGFRIELGEIEARLLQCSGVREAVVLARQDSPGEKRLVAYLLSEQTLDHVALRAQLASHLADYMIPSAFVCLNAWPLSPNGKLDRQALPPPDHSALITRGFELPRGEIEETLAQIWQELLHLPHVGRHDHFFELGGHSLLAIQVSTRLRLCLGREVPLRELFAHPVLQDLAQWINQAALSYQPPLLPAPRDAMLPLSWAQQRLWFLDQLDQAASVAYHIPAALQLEGPLNLGALRASLDQLLHRHESLRTCFPDNQGQPHQRVLPQASFQLTELDFSTVQADQQAADVQRCVTAEVRTPFDLEHGPLIRGQLLKLGDEQHVLLITLHHIICDGWSIGVIVRELSTLYTAFSQQQPDPLPPLAIQYPDYAAWQRDWLQGERLQLQQDFWRAQLDGAPELLQLPTDHPRPAVQSYRGASVPLVLTAELSAALRALAQRHGVTLHMTLLAAWSLLLARLSGQRELVIGTPVANRQRSELEPLIGFFVNTLALRVQLDSFNTLPELLNHVRELTLAAYAHQDLPFEQVVEAMQPARSLSHSPLFQVMLALNNTPVPQALQLPGLTLTPLSSPHLTTHFDLSLSLTDNGTHIAGALEYASDLFEPDSIGRMCSYLTTLLSGMVSDSPLPLNQLPLLSMTQREQLLVEWNQTAAEFPTECCIQTLFEAQVQKTSQAAAVIHGKHRITYAELNAKSNQLARHLRTLGVTPNCLVALHLPRSLDFVIALLATLKAGGAFVPLDPDFPAERLVYMLENARAKVLITGSKLPCIDPASAVPVIHIDRSWRQLENYESADLHCLNNSKHLAYMIYTSGSTGRPKGALLRHDGAVNHMFAECKALQFNKAVNFLQNAPSSSDISIWQILLPLITGGATAILSDPTNFEELLVTTQENKLNIIEIVPSLLTHFIEWVATLPEAQRQLPDLDYMMVTGDVVSAELINAWLALYPQVPAINAYGPSEASDDVVQNLIRAPLPNPRAAVPIGRPLANLSIYILDPWLQPTPVGVPGQLYVAGIGVGEGYLGDPEKTAASFITNPFDPQRPRMYRTGDIAKYLPDGNIVFLGRIDHQIKIRGFRVELGEIEAALAACPGVLESVVVTHQHPVGDKRLVAYVVSQPGHTLSPAVLRATLLTTLAEYMVPSAFVLLEAMPLTPNGKVDRKALPTPDQSALPARQFEAPVGEIEQTIAQTWQELLHVPRVGRQDHFFELGGHSLLAIQVNARLRTALGREVPLRELFAHPVLQDLAHCVNQAALSHQPPLLPAPRDAALPLSWAQQRLWFLDQLDPAASVAYHMPAGFQLDGPLDVPALRASLDRLLERHESLRTCFPNVHGEPRQRVLQQARFSLIEHELCDMEQVQHCALEEVRTPFDLEHGPLIRGQLLKLGDQQHVLLITLHHIICDGWSVGIIVRELSALYTAFSQHQSDPLPPLAIQYPDYAAWQRSWLQGSVLQQQQDFWRSHLHGAPELLQLPTDHPRPPVHSYRGASVPLQLPEDLTCALRGFAQRHGVTLYMTLLAAWSLLLARLSGQRDLVIGTGVANRHRSEVEPLIGFFVNTLALRVQLENLVSVPELLSHVRELTLAAYAHQDLPFEQVVEAVNPPRSRSHSPLFQALFTFNNTPASDPLALPGLTLSTLPATRLSTRFDLSLLLDDDQGSLAGNLSYATDLFEHDTIVRLGSYLVSLLQAMVADDTRPLYQLPLLSLAQRAELIDGFNRTERDFPREQLIHQGFEEQCRRDPDALAVICEDQTLSYRELNQRANQLAHRLIALGVAPQERIALCLERSLHMPIAMLAVLKAGAAYVPLDPHCPAERLAFMLRDCAPKALLSQQALRTHLPELQVPLICLDEPALCAQYSVLDPELRLRSDQLAYLIYTSGSTGQPKGVMVEHRSAVNFAQAMRDTTHQCCPPNARIGWNAAYFFDMSLKGFLQLLFGHTLIIIPQAVRASGASLLQFIEQQRIDALDSTPSQLNLLIEAGLLQPTGHRPLTVLLGGEPISSIVWQQLARCAHTRFFNMYGPTECTVDATLTPITAERVHLGPPLANARVYLLDSERQPVPLGVTGEIYIGGVGVARGYLNRPELTAERFVPDPFVTDPTARMYKTGDLARWLPDGNLEYLGRNDFQVKIRGFRIELGEIEARLLECAGVREAAVIAREDTPGDKRLVAYLSSDTELDLTQLRSQLALSLAEYMLPSAFVTLTSWPLTPNGKLDRQALPAPDHSALVTREFEAPVGEIEQTLAQTWQALLELPRLSRHDQFFELGGHSLMVIVLIERLREQGWRVGVHDVFDTPVLHQLAQRVQRIEQAAGAHPSVPPNSITQQATQITPDMLPLIRLSQAEIDRIIAAVPSGIANVQDIYPLAPLQQGILFHHLMHTEGDAYISRKLIAFDSRTRLDAFLDALQAVIDRHDILRSAFHWSALSQPVQLVQRDALLPVEELQLSADRDALDQLLQRTDPRQQRLCLQQAPLMIAYAAHDVREQRWLLALLNHHMISDHLTLEFVLQEILLLLQNRSEQLPPPLPYRNFIAQLQATPESEHEAYFTRQLADVDSPTAPFGVLNVHGNAESIQEHVLPLPERLAQRIRHCARQLGTSPAVLFHVGFAQVLAHCSQRDDVVFGTVLSGRLQGTDGADQVLGMFINTLPIRIPLRQASAAELVHDAQQRLAELLQHEQAPLALAQRCSHVAQPLPLFTALLNYRHNRAAPQIADDAWQGIQLLQGEERTNYPLSLSVDDSGQGFSFKVQCAPGIDAERIAAYLQQAVLTLTEELSAQSGRPLLHADILPPAERTQLLTQFNSTAASYPDQQLAHQLFEAHAARQPDALAVLFEEQSLSYRQLNERANQLADRLIALGVRPEDRLALCLERGPQMVVALLATLKAGAAYLPLDPNYPAERLAYMLEDGAPAVLITQQTLQARLPELSVPVLDVDDARLQPYSMLNPEVPGLSPQHLAYVIYTSGSTGRPKGVMNQHRGLCNLASAQRALLEITPDSRVLQFASWSFDASIWETVMALANGASLHLASRENLLPGPALLHTLQKHRITHATLPASALQVCDLEAITARLTLVLAGEALPVNLAQRWASHHRLFNAYGPTETTVCATAFEYRTHHSLSVPIGRPIANMQIYILDARHQSVPLGVAGEIYIGGVGVARGYLNRPELTAERFVKDPFAADPTARLYKTGDLGRWLPDGNLEYLGRNDFQVKIRGFRIELGEIEARLLECAGVREAVVIAREDSPGDKRLVAYLLGDAQLDPTQLRTQLASSLAEYMIPSAFVCLQRWPLTANGKLDRNALPAPDQSAVITREFEAPLGEVEQSLAEIWQELLKLPRVGRHDHFFELGGHSLLAVQLQTRIRELFDVELSLKQLFEAPQLQQVAERITAVQLEAIEKELSSLSEDHLKAILATGMDPESN